MANKEYSEKEKLNLLRTILLKENQEELVRIKTLLDSPEQLAEKVTPIFKDKIIKVKEVFPQEFHELVEREIEIKLKNSHQELLSILTPYFGKLIQQYIKFSISKLQEDIQASIDEKLSIFSFFKNKKDVKIASTFRLDEVLIVEKYSGILRANATNNQNLIDRDVIAGMFTAIKGFVEDAFEKGSKELEFIEYNDYNIFIHTLSDHYFIFVGSGTMHANEKKFLNNKIFDFIEENQKLISSMFDQTFEEISTALNKTFFDHAT